MPSLCAFGTHSMRTGRPSCMLSGGMGHTGPPQVINFCPGYQFQKHFDPWQVYRLIWNLLIQGKISPHHHSASWHRLWQRNLCWLKCKFPVPLLCNIIKLLENTTILASTVQYSWDKITVWWKLWTSSLPTGMECHALVPLSTAVDCHALTLPSATVECCALHTDDYSCFVLSYHENTSTTWIMLPYPLRWRSMCECVCMYCWIYPFLI